MTSSPCKCRSCGADELQLVLDLGVQPLANNLLLPADLGKPEPRFPLRLFVCRACWLMQIGELVPPVDLFSDYLYFSSFSDTMLRHARAASLQHTVELGLGSADLVVEIASNDGYLLKNFKEAGIPCLGIEPAANVAAVAAQAGIESLVEFFGADLARRLAAEGRQASLILGNNVFAHAPETNDFVEGLKILLKPGGSIALEFPHGLEMLEKNEFDTIYHEHVYYFTLTALKPLFERHGLEIYRVEPLPIHGGSLRVHACHAATRPVQASVPALLALEQAKGATTMATYEAFAQRAHGLKAALTKMVRDLRGQGGRVAAYGASAKGSTLLNFCGLDSADLDFVVDRSTYKQGRLTPGTHIPILPTEELAARQPAHTLLLTWNFAEEIMAQQAGYRQAGGRFIVPIPEVRLA